MMFLGEFQQNITEGCRLALPKKIREKIAGMDVILSKGFEKCIFGYAPSDWEVESLKQLGSPISDARSRNLKRYMYSGASEVAMDRQGRFVLPGNLKSYAGINEKVVVLGAGDHFEIWEESVWTENLKEIEREVTNE